MLMKYFELGGIMMWPLLICSILLIAVILEKLISSLFGTVKFWKNSKKIQASWHKTVMPFFIDIPPSIGLLGTVVGVVQSFNLTGGRLTADTAAAGLGVACFTTVFGLAISITASIFNYLLTWSEKKGTGNNG